MTLLPWSGQWGPAPLSLAFTSFVLLAFVLWLGASTWYIGLSVSKQSPNRHGKFHEMDK